MTQRQRDGGEKGPAEARSAARDRSARRASPANGRRSAWRFAGLLLAGAGLLRAQAPAGELTSRPVGAWGLELGDQDRSIRPGDDFYRYQNGGWLDRTVLGPDLSMAAYWRDLRLLAPRRLVALLADLAARSPESLSAAEAKVATFYRTFLRAEEVEAKGVAPLEPEIEAIRRAVTRAEISELMGSIEGSGTIHRLAAYGRPVGRSLFRVDIAQDPGEPARVAVFLQQAGLLLPGPEFYLEAQFADVRAAYEAYTAQMLEAIGWPEARVRAREILDFETRIAAASWSHEQMLDPVRTYNPMTVAELAAMAPAFDWRGFLRGAGLARVDRVVVDARGAFPAIAAAFAATPVETLQARLAFAAADYSAPYLNESLGAATLAFRGKILGNAFLLGVDRTLRAERSAELSLGEILGSLYVARYSSPEAKAMAEEMAARMREAFDARLARCAWMSAAGRAGARDKLARMSFHIGYPDHFDDYRGLEIRDHDLYGNIRRAAEYDWRRRIESLGRPFDRSAWVLAAEYPNYNYVATTNTVEIPAALLQPPFFDPRADPAVNYGALGVQIGQMIVSGFVGQGLPYDGEGRLRPWLPPDDAGKFAALAAGIGARYSNLEALPGLHLKGELLVDEAVGDLGGLQIAFDAYHASQQGGPAPLLDGTTGDQRFFLGRAQMWRAKFPPAFIRNQVATGANAPPFARVVGPLPHLDAWYEAFDVKPGDRMYVAPEDRTRVW